MLYLERISRPAGKDSMIAMSRVGKAEIRTCAVCGGPFRMKFVRVGGCALCCG